MLYIIIIIIIIIITLLFVLVPDVIELCCFSRFDIELNKSSMFCVALLNSGSCTLI